MRSQSIYLVFLVLISFIASCTSQEKRNEKWKAEIMATENAFSRMAAENGIEEAFLAFAAEDAVLLRNDSLIIGKSSLRARFNETAKNPEIKVSLTWKPDFIDVSASGDLGYTYGQYLYQATDSTGNTNSSSGIFHTVWKRQDDGTWRYVWD